jgi:hypothetical protein
MQPLPQAAQAIDRAIAFAECRSLAASALEDGMTTDSRTRTRQIFDQLRQLRQSVSELATSEQDNVRELRGAQTQDTDEAIQLSFAKLQDQIAGMEETLATIAEATGEIPKLT